MTPRAPHPGDEAALEAFFAAARAEEPAPRTALLSAILADAAEVHAARARRARAAAAAARPAGRASSPRSAAGAASPRSAPAPRSASGSASPATSRSTAPPSPPPPRARARPTGWTPSSTTPRWSSSMADAPLPRRPRLKWALVASLGLNLVFVGLFAAALFRGPPPPPMPGLWHYARALPEPYRRDLGRALRDEPPRLDRPARRAPRPAGQHDGGADRRPLRSGRRRTRCSPARRELMGDLSTRGRALLLAEITRMSPAERAAYAEALTADRGRGPRPSAER